MTKWWSIVWRPGNQALEHSFNQTTGLCSANLPSFIYVTPCPPMSYLGFWQAGKRQHIFTLLYYLFSLSSPPPPPTLPTLFPQPRTGTLSLEIWCMCHSVCEAFPLFSRKNSSLLPNAPWKCIWFLLLSKDTFLSMTVSSACLPCWITRLYWFISACPMHSRAPAPEQEVNKWLLTDVESAINHQGFGCLDQWSEKELGAGKDMWLWSRNNRGTYWKLPQEGKLF